MIELANYGDRPVRISGITLLPDGSAMVGGKSAQLGFVGREYFFDVYDTLTDLKRAGRREGSAYTFWDGTAVPGRAEHQDQLPSKTSAAFPFTLKPGDSKVFVLYETLRIVDSSGRPVSLPIDFRDRQILLFRMLSRSVPQDENGNFRCMPGRVALQVDYGQAEHVADTFTVNLVPSDGCYIEVPCPTEAAALGVLLENWKRKPDSAAREISPLSEHKGRTTPFLTAETAEFRNRLEGENPPLFLRVFPESMSRIPQLRGGMVFVCDKDEPRNKPEAPATIIDRRGEKK